jgi:hypothetical protein
MQRPLFSNGKGRKKGRSHSPGHHTNFEDRGLWVRKKGREVKERREMKEARTDRRPQLQYNSSSRRTFNWGVCNIYKLYLYIYIFIYIYIYYRYGYADTGYRWYLYAVRYCLGEL